MKGDEDLLFNDVDTVAVTSTSVFSTSPERQEETSCFVFYSLVLIKLLPLQHDCRLIGLRLNDL